MLSPLWREGGVEHPAGLAHQSLGGPGVAVVEVGDDGVEQVGGDGADRAELVDGGQVDDAFADQLLGALGELEHLHARGDALLGPAERLRGAVLGQAALEHRADGLGLLVGVELLARDVLDGAVGVLGLRVADDDRHRGQAERPGGRDAVEAGDQLEAVAVVADDDRDEHALKSDRAGECLDVLGVEVADVVGDADVDERDVAPGLLGGGGHQALLWCLGPAPLAGRSPATRTAKPCHPGVAGRPVSGRRPSGLKPVAVATEVQRAQLLAASCRSGRPYGNVATRAIMRTLGSCSLAVRWAVALRGSARGGRHKNPFAC